VICIVGFVGFVCIVWYYCFNVVICVYYFGFSGNSYLIVTLLKGK
jgi:hypothetical protein